MGMERCRKTTHSYRRFHGTKEVQQSTMQKPRLSDARSNVYAYGLDNELPKKVSLCLGVPIFRREAYLEDDVNCSTDVHFVDLSVDGHAYVLLLPMEQHRKRRGPCSGIRRTEFARSSTIVDAVLLEQDGKMVIDERAEICSKYSRLQHAEH
jgi:hypothetical protein